MYNKKERERERNIKKQGGRGRENVRWESKQLPWIVFPARINKWINQIRQGYNSSDPCLNYSVP